MANKRVLIVEDHPSNLRLLGELLEMKGYHTSGVGDGSLALSKAREYGPHLILMDLQLPGIDGIAAIRQLKADAQTRNIPIIAVTANVLSEDEDLARAAGCDDFLSKPLQVPQFFAALERFLK